LEKKLNILLAVIFITFVVSALAFGEDQNVMVSAISSMKIDSNFKGHAVFYPQHQDDETLWAGSAIVSAIEECGRDNVYVVMVSDGSGVRVLRNREFKGLTRKDKRVMRNREFKNAVSRLGVKSENIIIIPNNLSDKARGRDYFEAERNTILGFESEFHGNVTHIAHDYKFDDHRFHRMNGEVLKRLSDNKQVSDSLYFIKPWLASKVPVENQIMISAENEEDYNKIKSACDAYNEVSEKDGLYGIGYRSSGSYFRNLLKDKELKSILLKE
jgi:hypothetical protein